jgi:hypothetical protein
LTVARELGAARTAALAIALTWSVALIVGAYVLPVYSSDVPGTADTLVAVNGNGVAITISVPLVITLAVAALLWRRRSRDAGAVAWTLTGLLVAGNLLAMLSIGVFVLPVTICLLVACARGAPAGAQRYIRPEPS